MLIWIWWILLLAGRASFGELPHCAKESAADGEKKPEDVLVREAGMKLEVRFSENSQNNLRSYWRCRRYSTKFRFKYYLNWVRSELCTHPLRAPQFLLSELSPSRCMNCFFLQSFGNYVSLDPLSSTAAIPSNHIYKATSLD